MLTSCALSKTTPIISSALSPHTFDLDVGRVRRAPCGVTRQPVGRRPTLVLYNRLARAPLKFEEASAELPKVIEDLNTALVT